MKTVFLRVLESADKATALLEAVRSPKGVLDRLRFDIDTSDFAQVPRSPFAYWVSDRLRRLFAELPPFESEGRTAKQGLATADDFRWLRLWVEGNPLQHSEAFLVPIVKGGVSSAFYLDVPLAIRWGRDGRWMKEWKLDQLRRGLITANNSRCWNEGHYFRPGLTWPLRGAKFSARAVPSGCIFSVAGKMAFVPADDPVEWIALFNSEVFDRLIAFFAGEVRGVLRISEERDRPFRHRDRRIRERDRAFR